VCWFRYIKIVHPFHYERLLPPAGVKWNIVANWTIAIVIGGLVFVWRSDDSSGFCNDLFAVPVLLIVVFAILPYVIVTASLVVIYARIFTIALRHQRAIAATSVGTGNDVTGPATTQKMRSEAATTCK
jgi:hypothetical protein